MIAILIGLVLCDITGECTAVTDGDTIKVLVDRTEVTVRLSDIDAPERKQPFGTKSREALVELVHRKQVSVNDRAKDRYGRTLGTVKQGGKNINEEMIRSGMAWHYKKYSKNKDLARLEAEARESGRGLWREKDPVPPWEWRKNR